MKYKDLSIGFLLSTSLFLLTGFTKQDEPARHALVAMGQPSIVVRGDGEMTMGKACIPIPEGFLKLVDKTKGIQCIATPNDPCVSFSARLDLSKGTIEVWDGTRGHEGTLKFSWLLMGSAK
jgi:hypothetical protein